jgi:hypothetical protein
VNISDEVNEPAAKPRINICLAHIFKTLDMNKTNEYLKCLFLNKYFANDSEIKNVLSSLIDLLAWPMYASMDQWCIGFMTLLTLINKYVVLIEIAEMKIDFVRLTNFCSYFR